MVCLATTICFAATRSSSLEWSKDIKNIGHGLLKLLSETIDIIQWLYIGALKASKELNWIDSTHFSEIEVNQIGLWQLRADDRGE